MMLSKLPEDEREKQAGGYGSHKSAMESLYRLLAVPVQERFRKGFNEARNRRVKADYTARSIDQSDDAVRKGAITVIGVLRNEKAR